MKSGESGEMELNYRINDEKWIKFAKDQKMQSSELKCQNVGKGGEKYLNVLTRGQVGKLWKKVMKLSEIYEKRSEML